MTEKWLKVADRQAGAITAAQMRESGLSLGQQRALVRSGLIGRVGHGIYLLSSAVRDWRCSLWIELLLAGPGAFACRRTAATLWRFDGVEPGQGFRRDRIEVGVDRARRPRRPGTARLGIRPGDLARVSGVPLTSPERTLLDLGSVVDEAIVERSLECALRERLLTLDALPDLAQRAQAQRMPGARRLYRVLQNRPPRVAPTESDAETLFVQLARDAGFPAPARQTTLILRGRKYRLDFCWRHLRLAVEIDSALAHGPDRLSADLYRQNQLLLDGWLVMRFTWYQLTNQSALVTRDLRAAWALRTLEWAAG